MEISATYNTTPAELTARANASSPATTAVQTLSPAATTTVAFNIECFTSKFSWIRWVKRLESAFVVFNVPDNLHKHYLLHYMGTECYDILCNQVAPSEPQDLDYKVIVEKLRDYYDPTPLEIAENYRFHQRKQQDGETVMEFLVELQKLSMHCNFGQYLRTALRNQLVFGLRSARIQSRLLETKNLTLELATDIAVGMELSAKDAQQLHSGDVKSITAQKRPETTQKLQRNKNSNPSSNPKHTNNYNNVNARKLQSQNANTVKNTYKNTSCFRCGDRKHLANKCTLSRSIKCGNCGVAGHLQKVCMKSTPQANLVEDILQVEHEEYREKYMVEVELNGKRLPMELDSGATVTLMSKAKFVSLFPDLQIKNTKLKLTSYCKKLLTVIGYTSVLVKYEGETKKLNLYIVDGNREPLFGREWMRNFNLKLMRVNSVEATDARLNALFEKYSSVFGEDTGKVKDIQAKVTLKQNATPVFLKARPVPFSLLPKIDKEIERLVANGILEKVDRSEWATPVVPVQKANGEIRLCGDFKVTVNPNLIVDDHPLPTIDELFASMAGGDKFSKIDLRQAYLQLEVRPEDRDVLTVNTHRGLFRPTRLLYGIA